MKFNMDDKYKLFTYAVHHNIDIHNLSSYHICMALARSNCNNSEITLGKDSDVGVSYGLAAAATAIGCIVVVMNLIVLIVLFRNFSSLMKHVFYVIVAHFLLIDIFRGILIFISAIIILKPDLLSSELTILAKQMTFLLLLFCNMVIMFNVLTMTLNEYLFVCKPFKYHIYVNRARVMILFGMIWLMAIGFVSLSVVLRKKETVLMMKVAFNSTNSTETSIRADGYTRTEDDVDVVDVELMFNMALLGLCFVCLVIIWICYAAFFIVVRRIHLEDEKQRAQSGMPPRKESNISFQTPIKNGARKSSIFKPRSSEDGAIGVGDEKRIRKQVLRRYKYALVIGLVITVYMLYLVSYAVLQMISAKIREAYSDRAVLIGWAFKTVYGIHAILQTLCFLRVPEFRQKMLACVCTKTYMRHLKRDEYTLTCIQDTDATNDLRRGDSAFDGRKSTTVTPDPTRKSMTTASPVLRPKRKESVSFADTTPITPISEDSELNGRIRTDSEVHL